MAGCTDDWESLKRQLRISISSKWNYFFFCDKVTHSVPAEEGSVQFPAYLLVPSKDARCLRSWDIQGSADARRSKDTPEVERETTTNIAVTSHDRHKQRVLMHGHQGWNVRHGLCHIYMRYVYIYIWVVYSLCFFCCLFITMITVTWWYVWCFEWASGNQEEIQACLVTLWLFIISCYSLYKTTLGLLWSWFENNPHFHKYSMDFHV